MKLAALAPVAALLVAPASARADCLLVVGRSHTCYADSRGTASHAVAPLWTDIAFALHVQPLGGVTFTAPAGAGLAAYSVRASQLASVAPLSVAHARVALQVHPRFYVGLDGAWGLGVATASPIVFDAVSTIVPQQVGYEALGAVVGTSLAAGRWMFRLEVLGGVRNLWLDSASFVREQTSTSESDALQGFVAPRAQVEWWVGSAVTIGAWAGVEISPGTDVGFVGGVALAGHLRTLDATGDR